jgi:hypothetical protein
VSRLIVSGPANRCQHTLQDVVYVGVVPFTRAVAELLYRLAGREQTREPMDSQIRSLPRAIHREEPQRRDPQAVQVVKHPTEKLACSFRSRIRRDGIEGRGVFSERSFGHITVDRR